MSEVLEQRFEKFKKSIKIKKYGIQWEKDRKNFSVSYRKGVFENLGNWDFFPVIYQKHFIQDDLKQSRVITGEVQLKKKKIQLILTLI